MRVARHNIPKPGNLRRIGFTAYHRTLRVAGMLKFVTRGEVVIARNIPLADNLLHGLGQTLGAGEGV